MATEDEILGSRIIGYIEPIERNEHAHITVIGYKNTNDEYISIDKKTAKSIFSPDGKVFAAYFQQERNTSILKSSFVEFSAKIRKDAEPRCDKYNVDYDKNLAPKTFLPILPINYQTSLDHGFITQDELNSCIDKTTIKEIGGSFLLKYNNHLYGLFIYDKNTDEIRPKQGKEVKSYEIDSAIMNTCRVRRWQTDYLLRNIDKTFRQDGIIDCMDDNQLGEWFKTLIKTTSKSECLLELKKESYQDFAKQFKETNDAIDEVRLERIKGKLNALEWTVDEIRELMETNSSLTFKLTEALKKMKEEYHADWSAEFEHEKASLNADIETLTLKKSRLEKELVDLAEIVQEKRMTTKTDMEDIEAAYITKKEQYESILATKKARMLLYPDFNFVKIEPICFEAKGSTYTDISENEGYSFSALLRKNIYANNIADALKNTLNEQSVLFSKRACFIPSVSWAYYYAKAIRNSKLYVIHVEHDWLHFKDFMNNGLESVFKSCFENDRINHALVFDSLNLTQPECGLKPFLDVIAGYSLLIPCINKPFPYNLKVFATIVDFDEEHKIGLPLNKETFSKWGTIATVSEKLTMQKDFLNCENAIGYFEPKDIYPDNFHTNMNAEKDNNHGYF